MSEWDDAAQRQMTAAQRSRLVDRSGWTRQQWIEDADRLMGELDGAVTSLVNGHVLALLAFYRSTVDEVELIRQACYSRADLSPEFALWLHRQLGLIGGDE